MIMTPEKKLHQFLKQFGGQLHPEFWFQVCSVCREPVQRFSETLQAISELKKKLTRISKQLKGRIYNTKDVGGAEEGLTCIWEEIRAEVVKDLYRAPFEVEKKTSNQKGTPVDDGDVHMPTSEVLPETLPANSLPPTAPEEEDKDVSHSDFEPDGVNEDVNSSSHSDSSEDEKFKPPKRKPVLKRKSNPISTPDSPPKLRKKRKRLPAGDPSRQYTISRKGSTSYYKCNLCSAISTSNKRVMAHLSCHEKGEGSTCILCGWLVHPGGMNRHNSHFHPEQYPKEKKKVYFYTCPKCPARSHDHTFMEKHLPLHEPSNTEETTTCKLCGWLVPTKRLRHHMASPSHAKRMQNQETVRVVQEITTEIPYYCDHCPVVTTRVSILQQHFELYHEGKVEYVACVQPDCGERFVSKQLLSFHLEKDHKLPQPAPPEEEGDRKCAHCELVFNSKTKLDYHFAKTHKSILFTCTTCNITLNSYREYRKHMEETKAHATSKMYACELCGESFFAETKFKQHQRQSHFAELGLEPFMCEVCGLILSSKASLNDHLRAVHRKERNFSCEYCGQAFGSRKRVRLHVTAFHTSLVGTHTLPEGSHFRLEKGHDGGETWHCEFCTAIFPNRASVRNHILRNHYEEIQYVCEGCGSKYPSSMGLHRHRKSCAELLKKCESEKKALPTKSF
ncbi:putative zinc finger protein [Orchesella cincta]|uniref:Putative zinc finger protein n=1 Tax=Orchesella cincta TaxID=48709 RepID=A0A1D2MCS7_ORCCI|nr:putative zinc finger protein [Orchesella cincta]